MSSSTIITDYLGAGTHAARPASPAIPASGIAFYYETDTGSLYVWESGAWSIKNDPRLVYVGLSALTASVGVTTLLAVPVTGLYRASGAIQLTAAGTSGTVASSIIYADVNLTSTIDALVPAVTFGTITNHGSGDVVFFASAGTPIQYFTTVTSPVGIPVYAAQFSLVRLS